jgi:hypothetical protein
MHFWPRRWPSKNWHEMTNEFEYRQMVSKCLNLARNGKRARHAGLRVDYLLALSNTSSSFCVAIIIVPRSFAAIPGDTPIAL